MNLDRMTIAVRRRSLPELYDLALLAVRRHFLPLLGLALVGCGPWIALDTWLLHHVTTTQHSSGTCKMGPASDPLAVVDQHCRVHGLAGLRVADASVMPDVIRANTNATTIMIAERVADFMRQGM